MAGKTQITRTSVLNALIGTFGYKSYLEIGVNDPYENFEYIDAAIKIGVDPVPLRADILKYTSDEYFTSLSRKKKFDLIFIDGLHHYDQVLRDIEHSLQHLKKNGYIVCHDMLPENEEMQKVPRRVHLWTGDCWKAWAHLRMTREDLEMFVLNTDRGLGIIKPGSQDLFPIKQDPAQLNYAFLVENKTELMNVVEVTDVFTN